MSQSIAAAMPSILRHEGVWQGVYRDLDADGVLIDQHRATVRCEFPTTGPYAYVQHNRFTWADGRELTSTLPGVLRNGFKRILCDERHVSSDPFGSWIRCNCLGVSGRRRKLMRQSP